MVTTKYVSSWNYSGKYQKWNEEEEKKDWRAANCATY